MSTIYTSTCGAQLERFQCATAGVFIASNTSVPLKLFRFNSNKMARFFYNSTLVLDTVSSFISRRGYAAAVSGGVRGSVGINDVKVMLKKGGEESSKKSSTSWLPDPVTGYYRPESHAKEIDAAELRQMLLKHKPRQH